MPQRLENKSPLSHFFAPRGVVVVGASSSRLKLGHGVARNLAQSGFSGRIEFVGQAGGSLFGRTIRHQISEVPGPVDLAVLVIAAASVPLAIQQCAARGIHAVIILSAGFREAGPEGAALERQCLEMASLTGVRLLGPNCIGVIDTHLPLDTSFLQPPMPSAGGIGFISHSGAFCAAIVDWSRGQGFGFSRIVSLGNQVDLNECDFLPTVADDEHTRAIVLYMEGVSDGRRFVEVARSVSPRTPVLALKVGRTESGSRAAASHTAAMAGTDAAFDAAFEAAGVLRAVSTEQLFDWARALEVCPLPAGRRVAVLTDAGGPGVIAADALESLGMRLATLSAGTRADLTARLPAAASTQNPVDMLASASPADYLASLQTLLADDGVDSVLVILPPPPMFTAESVAGALIPEIRTSRKAVVVALLGSTLTEKARLQFRDGQVATYPFPERAASALAVLSRRADDLAQPFTIPTLRPFSVMDVSGPLPYGLLDAYGITSSPLQLARSADEAAAAARAVGFPVVLKIASPQITHKSDVGGVLMGLANEAEVRSGYAQAIHGASTRAPGASVEGVYVQAQAPTGQDIIVGAHHDPQFGPMIMFGAGGIETEALHDVAFALAPVDETTADRIIQRTWAGRRLLGFRGISPADAAAAREVVVRLSWLIHDHPEIDQLEINPLRVFASGAQALDVRMA